MANGKREREKKEKEKEEEKKKKKKREEKSEKLAESEVFIAKKVPSGKEWMGDDDA